MGFKEKFGFAIALSLLGYLLSVISNGTSTLLLVLSCLVPMVGWSVFFLHSEDSPRPSNFKTEQAYLIRTKRAVADHVGEGYPMTVNEETMQKAIATGDYEYEGPATYKEAGNLYVNDGSGGTGSFVPGGHIEVKKSHYQDKRLN